MHKFRKTSLAKSMRCVLARFNSHEWHWAGDLQVHAHTHLHSRCGSRHRPTYPTVGHAAEYLPFWDLTFKAIDQRPCEDRMSILTGIHFQLDPVFSKSQQIVLKRYQIRSPGWRQLNDSQFMHVKTQGPYLSQKNSMKGVVICFRDFQGLGVDHIRASKARRRKFVLPRQLYGRTE